MGLFNSSPMDQTVIRWQNSCLCMGLASDPAENGLELLQTEGEFFSIPNIKQKRQTLTINLFFKGCSYK
jgi:hypothetical protein